MKKLVMAAVAAAVSMAVTAAYAETTTNKDVMRLAAATTADPGSVSDSNTSPGPSGKKGRTPSGKQRKAGPDAGSVNDTNTSPGPSGKKGRTPSGKQRKAGPDTKSVDDNTPAGSQEAGKKK